MILMGVAIVVIIGGTMACVAAIILILAKIDRQEKRTMQAFNWESPFPAEDGYAEVDLDEIIDAVRKNPAAAAAEYNGRKVIFKGKASVEADGDIDVKGMLQESKGYSYCTYSALCMTNGDRSLLDAVKNIDNSTRTTVYVKGMITDVSNCTITVETKELACFCRTAMAGPKDTVSKAPEKGGLPCSSLRDRPCRNRSDDENYRRYKGRS